jgi:hypothetical protein
MLWLHSSVPQRLFDAACQMRNLDVLWIHWSSVKDLTPLCRVKSLRFLNIGSSPQIRSIDPLAAMTGLKWLQLENLKLITDLGPLAGLDGLDGLGFSGSPWVTQKVHTLKPLAGLTALNWLYLFNLRSLDESLRPLEPLSSLVSLTVRKDMFPIEELAWVCARFPKSVHRIEPYQDMVNESVPFVCKKCGNESIVLTMGKGGGELCKICDAARLSRHVKRFSDALVASS